MKELVIKVRLDRTQAAQAANDQVRDTKRVADAEKQAAAEKKKANAEVLTEVQAMEKAHTQLVQAENKKRVEAAREVMREQKSGGEQIKSALMGVVTGINYVSAAYNALNLAQQAVGAVAGIWRAQREDIEKSVDGLAAYRQQVLETAALKDGRIGKSTPEVADQLRFRSETLQSRQAADAFQRGLLNAGNASKSAGFVDQDNLNRLGKYVGSYQAMTNVDPNALGNLAGLMPRILGGKGQKAEDVFSNMMGVIDILKQGGSDTGPAVNALMKNISLMGESRIGDVQDLAKVSSFYSITAHGEEATKTQQFMRASLGMQMKTRANKLLEGSESMREYGQDLGVTDQMMPLDVARLVNADLEKQRKKVAGKFGPDGKPLKFNELNYLATKGFNNEDDKRAYLDVLDGLRFGSFEGSFKDVNAKPTFKQAIKPIQDFRRSDPAAQAAATGIAEDMANAIKAVGPEEAYLNLNKQAFQNLRGSPKGAGITGTFDESFNDPKWQGYILDESRRLLLKRAKEVGIDTSAYEKKSDIEEFADSFDELPGLGGVKKFMGAAGLGETPGILGGSPVARGAFSNATRAKAAYELQTKIAEKGGNVVDFRELVTRLDKLIEVTERQEAKARNEPPKQTPEPLPGPPANRPGR